MRDTELESILHEEDTDEGTGHAWGCREVAGAGHSHRTPFIVVALADSFPQLPTVAPLHDEVNTGVILVHVKEVGHIEAVPHVHVDVNLVLYSPHKVALQELPSELFVDGLHGIHLVCSARSRTSWRGFLVARAPAWHAAIEMHCCCNVITIAPVQS